MANSSFIWVLYSFNNSAFNPWKICRQILTAGVKVIISMDWLQDASCRGKHPDIWYPPMDSPTPSDYYTVGKLVCANCAVWKECMNFGADETWGMWGGLTPQERRGTVRPPHGSIEQFRKGCRCNECMDHAIPQPLQLSKLPQKNTPMDIKALLFDLIGR